MDNIHKPVFGFQFYNSVMIIFNENVKTKKIWLGLLQKNDFFNIRVKS